MTWDALPVSPRPRQPTHAAVQGSSAASRQYSSDNRPAHSICGGAATVREQYTLSDILLGLQPPVDRRRIAGTEDQSTLRSCGAKTSC